jgi:hypothetical protein
MLEFPLLQMRLQEVMGRSKWEYLGELKIWERLKLVEKGYCANWDDDTCPVPNPF